MQADGWSGFHRLAPADRLHRVAAWAHLSPQQVAALSAPSALPPELAAMFVENAVGSMPLPLAFAVHFVVDGQATVVPMAVEESSVVAAASNGAKMAAAGGGFRTRVLPPVTIGQVEVRDVADPAAALRVVARNADKWVARINKGMASMVARGGGVKGVVGRSVGSGTQRRVVVHLHIDTREAMGANTVNSACEQAAPWIARALGGRPGLRILSNLADQRLATARCKVPAAVLGGRQAVDAIVAANRLAELDPYRAATHNKGIMNGVDPVLIATGNDWRAVEAGAHAYAARDGTYGALTRYRRAADGALAAEITMPMPVGTVGGVTRLHPVADACLAVLGRPDSRRLAGIAASVGLAQNLAALRALSQEGIQKGHMELHASNLALARAGPSGPNGPRKAGKARHRP